MAFPLRAMIAIQNNLLETSQKLREMVTQNKEVEKEPPETTNRSQLFHLKP